MRLPARVLADWLFQKLMEQRPKATCAPAFSVNLAVQAVSFLATWGVLASAWMLVNSHHSLHFILCSVLGGSLLYGTMMAVAAPSTPAIDRGEPPEADQHR